jgi:hypothetical protein
VLKVLGMGERSQAITFVLARSLRLFFVLARTIYLIIHPQPYSQPYS